MSSYPLNHLSNPRVYGNLLKDLCIFKDVALFLRITLVSECSILTTWNEENSLTGCASYFSIGVIKCHDQAIL